MMKTRNTLAAFLIIGTMLVSMICPSALHAAEIDVFYDDFDGDALNSDKWLVAEKAWGGFNGGVVPENVSVEDGKLKLEGHGNLYDGDIEGVNHDLPGGIRTGAAIATREYYASGSYEVVAKIAPVLGACSAMWTFEYEEYKQGTPEYEASGATCQNYIVNHEIDIEIPGRPSSNASPSFAYALCNSYTNENRVTTNYTKLPYAVDDGAFHTYRFDWHTGDTDEQPRVDYYIDGHLICVCTTNIPTNASRFWLGIWFPSSADTDKDGYGDSGWCGTADFDTAVFEIDSVKITPYHEAGDTPQKETYPKSGWAVDSFPEDIEAEHFDHVINGDFSSGSEGWQLFGDARINDGYAWLSSGAHTDTITQLVPVLPKMTYTLAADVVTDGIEVTIGVRKPNGTMSETKKVCTSGRTTVTFTTESGISEMELFAEVLRYQDDEKPVKVDNITLISGKEPLEGDPAVDPLPPDEDAPPASDTENRIQNGSFDEGEQSWTRSGSARIENGRAFLASGPDTDCISQIVTIEKGRTYTLSADVISSGTEIEIGVNDYNGRYTNLSKTVDASGKVYLTFTAAQHIDQVEIYLQVLRYQDNGVTVAVDDVTLVSEETVADEPDPQPPAAGEILKNRSFDDDAYWNRIGSAQIVNGKALLASGNDTDIIEQTVTLEPYTTYMLRADLLTSGCVVDLIVSDFNGKYSETKQSYARSAAGELVFTTGSDAQAVRISIHVLRYQTADNTVEVDNATLIKI